MKHRVLLDTNVLLDMAIPGRPGHKEAMQLLMEIEAAQVVPYVCATSLKDTYYVLGKAIEESDARAYISAVLECFSVCAIDAAMCKSSIMSNEPDFEDGLIRAVAETIEVDYIISRDTRAFMQSSIKRLSPEEYIANLSNWDEVSI